MNNKMNVICPSCGAEFNKNLSQCPYCGNSNYYGQEKSYMKGLAGLRQRLAELADINKKIIVEEAVKVLVLVLAVVIILVAAIFSVKAIDRHNESIAVNNIRKEIIDEDKYYTESHKKAIDRYDKDFNNTEKECT